ncbi:hypothetical protein QQF64_035103 [Cirrhinus molitorella]|uniref:Uncharacterized protein n=1 Tax=Cirrhinus molitorella TaxID=172907 RepID=A0ABR3NEU0_9TELE
MCPRVRKLCRDSSRLAAKQPLQSINIYTFTRSHTLSVTRGKGKGGVLAQGCMLNGGTLGRERDSGFSADPLHHACTRDKHPSLLES